MLKILDDLAIMQQSRVRNLELTAKYILRIIKEIDVLLAYRGDNRKEIKIKMEEIRDLIQGEDCAK